MRDLTPIQIKRLPPGVHRASKGLYVRVTPAGCRHWVHRYHNGRAHEQGLGSCDIVTLSEARDIVRDNMRLLRQGIDPIQHRRKAKPTAQHTFAQVAEMFIDAHADEWVPKHTHVWRSSLKTYAYPKLGEMLITAITTRDVLGVLEPIWHMPSAPRLRERVQAIWYYGKSLGWTQGDCPAAWEGCLKPLLASPSKRQVAHHAALPWDQMPAFMAALSADDRPAAQALRTLIRTNVRAGVILKATWSEFDLIRAVWTIPRHHMKNRQEFRVPLSAAVTHDLAGREIEPGERVFPSLIHDSMARALVRYQRKDATGQPITPHGFRSTFRDWAEEQTNYSRTVIEIAMQHSVGSEVEQSYRRGDLFNQRMSLMADWAAFCGG